MRIHYIQHVPFENPGYISEWAESSGIKLSKSLLYRGHSLPRISEFDGLIVMGGPMNIYEEDHYSWLKAEKKLIRNAIVSNKIVIGICLGAQLIADALGAKVYPNRYKEIGWFPVSMDSAAKQFSCFSDFPSAFDAFHWHGDTFDLPSGAIRVAKSAVCKQQAFSYNHNRVIGLQFHLESTIANAIKLVKYCATDLSDGPYIQSANMILNDPDRFTHLNRLMKIFLDQLFHV
jgi:GMP synthase (glutamine-hydrolysing)